MMIKRVFNLLLGIMAALVSSMLVVGADTHKESDGKSLHVDLTATVTAKQVAVVDGWLGIVEEAGDSGDVVALTIDPIERQFTVPSGLSVSKGDIVYVDVTDLTGHTPDDTAYSTSAGANKVAFFKATADKDGNDVVTGIVLPGNLAS